MKFIKQKSTDKIVYRESPHTDKTITNAVIDTNIDLADLEVVEESWSEDDWHTNTVSYQDKRKSEYPTIEELVVALYDDDDKAAIEKRRADVKAKYSKS